MVSSAPKHLNNQSSVLHITNGDSAAELIQGSDVSGDVLPWRDPMHHGPCPAVDTLDELSRIRIHYLDDGHSNLPHSDSHGFTERDVMLGKSGEYDEVVLWFEHDLLDQLQLLQLLDWFALHGKKSMALSLICIDQFAGVTDFRGLGQLSTTQMASLYSQRLLITQEQLDIATKFWQAFCHSEPLALLSLCQSSECDGSDLPFLKPALLRHMQEFPWLSDGLTRTERQILQLVSSGITNPVRVFVDNMNYETCLYIGDWRSYAHIHELCRSEQALLACADGAQFAYPPNSALTIEQLRNQELVITDLGRDVLAGKVTVVNTLVRDSWLGGVHLNSRTGLWCWNEEQQKFSKLSGVLV